ncbi:hypothetical protein SCHPADRAFT_946081 [Schizopora paradoxa]|uniref:Uncharacterized protein n=1 Tax=Schizopora paradoxa TaxID=27342 RepID=A0A0H2R3U4_9AGAM|nr:hypothetical protein SCHPADRAFT_946081 [Schizopora paradoxa]
MARTYSDKLAARLAKKRRHRTRSTLDIQTRLSIAKKAAATKASIAEALTAERARQECFVLEMAKKHNVAVSAMRQRVLSASSFKQTRKANKFNAWIHCRSLDINDNVPEGSRAKLQELQAQALAHEDYRSVPAAQLAAMVWELEAYRLVKKTGPSSQKNGRTQDIRFTTSRVDLELKNLRKRAQTSSLCITTNSRADQSGQPKLHVDPISRRFIEVGLGLDINEFSTKFEAFAVSGLCGVPTNDNDRRTLLKTHIRNAVRHGLRLATGINDLEMSWKYYGADIVRKYRVVLKGWPVNTFNLDRASRSVLETIISKIEEGTVAWMEATDEEIETHLSTIVEVEKTRKPRSGKDKGRKKAGAGSGTQLTPEEVPSDADE